ncbi:uncharacterized protein LOC109810528 [Cajanus cajan]|uniref:uncharacterized protein LOC109810528 n=1 Tax=Cajanus cajan TaxID=3821 RepID=UPI00098D96B9|nr:uncharacterized protein LOC109810528 [Cajanus cajan]
MVFTRSHSRRATDDVDHTTNMYNEVALRRLIEQVEQMRQQHTADLQSMRTKHETDLAALRTANEADLAARFAPNFLGALLINQLNLLPAESIDNFDTLVRRFTAQYATSRPHHVTSAALASLRQGNNESLRAFMERFASISVKIQNLNPEVALHAMLMALKPGPFVDSLCRRAPADMDELHARAVGYIHMEEHFAFHNQVHGKSQAKPDHGHKDKMKVTNDSQSKKTARANKGGDTTSTLP